jgi:hypothetical protein
MREGSGYRKGLSSPGERTTARAGGQVDVTSKTEGRAFADATGIPLLVKYDTRLRENVARKIVDDITIPVQARAASFHRGRLIWRCPAAQRVLRLLGSTRGGRLPACTAHAERRQAYLAACRRPASRHLRPEAGRSQEAIQ